MEKKKRSDTKQNFKNVKPKCELTVVDINNLFPPILLDTVIQASVYLFAPT